MEQPRVNGCYILHFSFEFILSLYLILITGSSGSNIHDWVNQPVVV